MLTITGTLALELLLKFIVSLASSFVFVFVILQTMKPRIHISDKICFKNDKDGKKFYYFKVVNMSIYDAYNVDFELHKKDPYIVDKVKVNHNVDVIKLSADGLYSIPRHKKDIGYGYHAVLIRTYVDLSKDIDKDNLEFVFYVSAKHGLSNLTKVTTQSFDSSNVFHEGNFKFGSNLDIC
ncbi:hypothetical protein [Ulvibacterium marinum]|uniref:hypothetical protein n=1 Tax=Ulvibacterium marinum TaxID=2419782 RepID=UPI0024954BA8|nr:hypothetical protein [Ulvibacterium marinum]